MALQPDIPVPELIDTPTETSRTYNLDFNNNRIVGFVDELDALGQFIQKSIITVRFQELIYSNQFGSELTSIDRSRSREFIQTEIERLVEEAIIFDPRINSVSNFTFNFVNDEVYVTFSTSTIFGTLETEVIV